MTTHTGTVKFFSRLKGYGIIDKESIRPIVSADVFVHFSDIEGGGATATWKPTTRYPSI